MNSNLLHDNYTSLLHGHLKTGQLRAFNQLHAVARKALPDFRLDCNGLDLQGRDLTGIDLQNADLIGAKLDHATLDKANLTNADLSDASLRHTTLKRAVLYYARAEEADFSHATLPGADMEGLYAKHARFCSASLQGTRLHRAYLIGSNATGADFSRAQMRETLFSFVASKGLILEGAQLADADIRGTDLAAARIKGAKMTYALFSTDDHIIAARAAGAVIQEDREYTDKELSLFRYMGNHPKSKERYDPLNGESSTLYGQQEWADRLSALASYVSGMQCISEPPEIRDGELLYPETGIRIRAAHAVDDAHMFNLDMLIKRYPSLAPMRATPTLPAFNRWLMQAEKRIDRLVYKDRSHSHPPALRLFFGSDLVIEPLASHAQDPLTREAIDILTGQCRATLEAHAWDPTKAYESLSIDQQTGNPVLTNEACSTLGFVANYTRPIHSRIRTDKYPSLRDLSDPLPPRLGEGLENKAGVGAPESKRVR